MGHRWPLALALAGCFSSKTAGPAPAPSNTAPPLVQAANDHRTTASDPLGFLPADSELVFHLDVTRLRKSAIWRQYEPMVMQAASSGLQLLKDTCGIDPLVQLRTIRGGLKDLDSGGLPQAVVVATGLDGVSLFKCFANAPRSARTTLDGNVLIGTDGAGQPFAFELVEPSTVVALFGPGTDRARLDDVITGGSPLRSSPTFSEIYSTLDTQGALWFLMNGNAKVFDGARASGLGFDALFGSIRLVDGLSASVRVRVASPSAASQMATSVASQLGMAKGFVARLDVSADANDVVLELGMTDAQINSLLGLTGLFNTNAPTLPISP